jgi:serine/threonine-protein kinase RsbW
VAERLPPSALERARLTVSCGGFARTLAGRFVAALAAETDLPLDRLDEAVLVAEAVADRCGELTPDGELELAVAVHSDRLELRVGPFEPGAVKRLLGADAEQTEHGGVIRGLASVVEIRRLRNGEEALHIAVAASGRGR